MGGSTSKFSSKTTAEAAADESDLSGKVMIVTGCNTGIGKETARVLVKQGADVTMACRNEEKATKAREEILAELKQDAECKREDSELDGSLHVGVMDLSSLQSVRQFAQGWAQAHDRLDCLVNNAGIMALDKFNTTADGVEKQFGVNHLGHFYLTSLLTPLLIQSQPSRVVILASSAHSMTPSTMRSVAEKMLQTSDGPPEDGYSAWPYYGLAKASNVMHARQLNALYSGQGVKAVSLHPGVIATELGRNLNGAMQFGMKLIAPAFFKSIPQGASTTVRCVCIPHEELSGGSYHADCNVADDRLSADVAGANEKMGEEPSGDELLWQASEALIIKLGFSLELTDSAEDVVAEASEVDDVQENVAAAGDDDGAVEEKDAQ